MAGEDEGQRVSGRADALGECAGSTASSGIAGTALGFAAMTVTDKRSFIRMSTAAPMMICACSQ